MIYTAFLVRWMGSANSPDKRKCVIYTEFLVDETLGKQTNERLEREWMILKLLLVQKWAMNRGLHHITFIGSISVETS